MKSLAVSGWIIAAALSSGAAHAYTLWSTKDSFLGTGEFHGPGSQPRSSPLFATVIRSLMFESAVDVIAPFSNNGAVLPNTCAQPRNARLADGALVNENIDMCVMEIGGLQVLPAAIAGGKLQGELISVTLQDGNVIMAMDFALDFSAAGKGVVHLPLYGTTGEVVIPKSLQTQSGGEGVDQAGQYPSGTKLSGRIGDFDQDGWIDGTILTTGVLPLDSPVAAGQPYLMMRHFVTDIPIGGQLTGDVRSLGAAASRQTRD